MSTTAKQIMQRGGPQSLEDYLFLFPGACPECGYRQVVDCKRQVGISMHGEPALETKSWRECTRCHHRGDISVERTSAQWKELDALDSPLTETPCRVTSPYLAQEQSDAIPEFPLAKRP